MAEPESKDPTSLLASRGQAPLVTLVVIVAAAVGMFNMSSRQGGGTDTPSRPAELSGSMPGPPPKANTTDAIEALEPLTRFLNVKTAPASLDEMARALDGYRVTTLIATISDPRDSRLGYDFDMALEAIQRAVESEGYTLDRFRLPWTDVGLPNAPVSAPVPGAGPPAGAVASPPAPDPIVATRGLRHERQPGTIVFRGGRQPARDGKPAVQDLLLLLLVGETPTWGIQQEALVTSLDIAWVLDVKRHERVPDPDHEPTVRILGPTFSGSADSLSRVIRGWAGEKPDRADASLWVCTGAATAVTKEDFQNDCRPAKVTYSATVIPDDTMLGQLYRYLADPTGKIDASTPALPHGKIALLVEGGSGYGAAVSSGYGTGTGTGKERKIISIPFPLHIAEVRSGATGAEPGSAAAKARGSSTPLDPPSGKQSDHLPTLSPRMTVATNNLIIGNILATIASEDIRYLGIVATDILDVIYLTRLVRENCPDVQIFLVGSDLRYTDSQFTLDFRGTIIASSYPLDPQAQVWSYPFHGDVSRRLFPNEFDVGRYNAGLILLNAVADPNHERRLVIDFKRAEDLLVYGKPFVSTFADSFSRRPQIWINQVGQSNVWPLKVVPLSECDHDQRTAAEELIPAVLSLDPNAEAATEPHLPWDFPLVWKLAVCAGSLLGFLLVAMILYTNLGAEASPHKRLSWFSPMLSRLQVSNPEISRKNIFFIVVLVVSLLVPYCRLVSPLDVIRPARIDLDGERDATLEFGWDTRVLAAAAGLILLWFVVPLVIGLVEVFRRRRIRGEGNAKGTAMSRGDRWLDAESLFYRLLTVVVILAGFASIADRIYRFSAVQPELPNDWLMLDRAAHLLGGNSPIIPVVFLGAAFASWAFLELRRLHSYPLLRRGADLLPLPLPPPASDVVTGTGTGTIARPRDWIKAIGGLNLRFRLCVDLLEYPMTVLISKNVPLSALMVSAMLGLAIFLWGVVWPRYIPTPEGGRFDLLIMVAVTSYLLLLLYSLVRYIWLWRSLLQLFREIGQLPMAVVFDRLPPRVAAKFARFFRTSIRDMIDLEIPLQQCRLVLDRIPMGPSGRFAPARGLQEAVAERSPGTDWERFETVSAECVGPVVEMAWPLRSLEEAFGMAPDAPRPKVGDEPGAEGNRPGPTEERWLTMAEDLVALRIVYLLCQFAVALRSLSSQLIYGPILLLLAISWYPFHPQRLISIVIWMFVIAGVLATLKVFLEIERSELVSRLSRTAPNSVKIDQAFLANLLPYAVPLAGFLLTLFPSLGYWLGSILEPIGRAVK